MWLRVRALCTKHMWVVSGDNLQGLTCLFWKWIAYVPHSAYVPHLDDEMQKCTSKRGVNLQQSLDTTHPRLIYKKLPQNRGVWSTWQIYIGRIRFRGYCGFATIRWLRIIVTSVWRSPRSSIYQNFFLLSIVCALRHVWFWWQVWVQHIGYRERKEKTTIIIYDKDTSVKSTYIHIYKQPSLRNRHTMPCPRTLPKLIIVYLNPSTVSTGSENFRSQAYS